MWLTFKSGNMEIKQENTTKRKYKKRKNWSLTEENVLLDLWEDNIEEIRKIKKKGYIYKNMSQVMCQKGMVYTAGEIRMKLHNLSQRYKKEKAAMRSSGVSPQWPLYQRIHQILGGCKINSTTVQLVEESIFDDISRVFQSSPDRGSPSELPGTSESPQSPMVSTSSTPVPIKKGKTKKFQKQLLNEVKKIGNSLQKEIERAGKVDERMVEIEEKKVNLLERYVNSNNELNNALIKYLNSKSKSDCI